MKITLLVLFLLFLSIGVAGAGIQVSNATIIFNSNLTNDSQISPNASAVKDRIVVSYANAIFNSYLQASNEINNNASLVVPMVVIQYANSIWGYEMGLKGTEFINIKDNFFNNSVIMIPVNTQVTWINFGSTTHTVTADDGSFNSGNLVTNQSFTYNFIKAGTFTYHCNIHPAMKGTVRVTSSIPTTGITVVSPNGGDVWQAGTNHAISWSYTGSPGSFVNITLLKGGVFNRTINSSIPVGSSGSGSYNWLINSTQALGTDYEVIVTSTANPAYKDTSNINFTISALAPKTGDINGNGQLTLVDAIYLAKHVGSFSGYEVIYADGDINANGKVTLVDAIYLAKHVGGFIGYEKIY